MLFFLFFVGQFNMPRSSKVMPPSMTTKEHYLAQCKAREAEDRRNNDERRRLADKAVSGYALWENKTADVIENNLITKRVEASKVNDILIHKCRYFL